MNKKIVSCTLMGVTMLNSVVPALATYSHIDDVEYDEKGNSVAEIHETQEIVSGQGAQTEVYAKVGSDFKVIIPKSLTISGTTKTGAYTVDVTGDISGTEFIKVVPEESFLLKTAGKPDVTANIIQDKIQWSYNEVLNSRAVIGNGEIYASGLTAGEWDGSFWFNISLEDLTSDENTSKEINLAEGEIVNAGEVQLGSGQGGSVKIMNGSTDVSKLATYSSDNPNISVTNGIIDTSKASAGEIANITVTYNEVGTQTASITDLFVIRASASNALQATFTVKVIGIEFDKENIQLKKGDSVAVIANLIPEGTEGTMSFKVSGLEKEVNGNTITIKTTKDTMVGNYTLVATYNGYSETLNIQVVEDTTESEPEQHVCNYNIEEIITPATCTEAGEKKLSCKCGESKTETIPENGHKWEDDFTVDVKAECEKDGSKSVHCSNCSETKYETTIPMTGHSYKDGTCENCGQAEPEQVTYVTLRSPAGETDKYSSFLGSKVENSRYRRAEISRIVFYADSSSAAGHYVADNNCWDVSDAQDGSIIAWATSDIVYSGTYNIHVAPKNPGTKIKLHENSSTLFRYLPAAYQIEGLENIGITVIPSGMFSETTYLRTISIPDSVTKIECNFYGSNLKSITWRGTTYTDKTTFNQALIDAGIATKDVWI